MPEVVGGRGASGVIIEAQLAELRAFARTK